MIQVANTEGRPSSALRSAITGTITTEMCALPDTAVMIFRNRRMYFTLYYHTYVPFELPIGLSHSHHCIAFASAN